MGSLVKMEGDIWFCEQEQPEQEDQLDVNAVQPALEQHGQNLREGIRLQAWRCPQLDKVPC